ncbi:hypothetical protein AB0J84_08025 [Micromonospora arborensis]|uniref:hypothetical protein n=1 Tax=Micromonospora arborensis TaxID=2116518 RepID=UPI003417C26E
MSDLQESEPQQSPPSTPTAVTAQPDHDLDTHRLGRLGHPTGVAPAYVLLASDEARYIPGTGSKPFL